MAVATSSRPDYYKANPPAQPKREIGGYVESKGILVPRRFESLEDARKSGLAILARSEHPQDYSGASGIIPSFDPNNSTEEFDVREFKRFGSMCFKDFLYLNEFCHLMGLDKTRFLGELSFSYWERLEGYNRTIAADSSVEGRYFILTRGRGEGIPNVKDLTIYEKKGLISRGMFKLTDELRNGVPDLIAAYEAVRNLPNFNPLHCPIMEFQTVGPRNYFLQYHRAREFEAPTFNLERDREPGETEAILVRGVTPEGEIMKRVTAYYENTPHVHACWNMRPLKYEEGSFDNHYNYVFGEVMVRKRDVQVDTSENLTGLAWSLKNHLTFSQMFKPGMFVSLNFDNALWLREINLHLKQLRNETGQAQYIDMHFVSDGRKGRCL